MHYGQLEATGVQGEGAHCAAQRREAEGAEEGPVASDVSESHP